MGFKTTNIVEDCFLNKAAYKFRIIQVRKIQTLGRTIWPIKPLDYRNQDKRTYNYYTNVYDKDDRKTEESTLKKRSAPLTQKWKNILSPKLSVIILSDLFDVWQMFKLIQNLFEVYLIFA